MSSLHDENGQRPILRGLAWMAHQYLGGDAELDSLCMSAGERARAVLAEHGLVTLTHDGRCAIWTEAGMRLLDERA